jgi:probable HAF family extracellular repeat protein
MSKKRGFERHRVALVCGAMALPALLLSNAQLSASIITGIGALPGDDGADPTAINDNGVIVGNSLSHTSDPCPSRVFHAFVYSGGTMHAIGSTGGGSQSTANDINNNDVVVGSAVDSTGTGHAYTFTGSGPLQLINGLSNAEEINDSGAVAGFGAAVGHGVRFQPPSTIEDLGLIGTDNESVSWAINNSGSVVGYSRRKVNLSITRQRAFVYNGSGPMQDLLGLPSTTFSGAKAINDSGVIVGETWRGPSPSTQSGFRYTGSSPAQTLLLPPGGGSVSVQAINNDGFVVGSLTTSTYTHAMLWRPDNSYVDLDTWLDQVDPAAGASWSLGIATGINSAGMIVGDTPSGLSNDVAFVLNASSLIPEPASSALIGAGLTLLTLRRRRI